MAKSLGAYSVRAPKRKPLTEGQKEARRRANKSVAGRTKNTSVERKK